MSTTGRRIPVDDRKVGEGQPTEADYDAADKSVERLREILLANPKGQAAYDRATAEIERHQAGHSLARLYR